MKLTEREIQKAKKLLKTQSPLSKGSKGEIMRRYLRQLNEKTRSKK